MAVAIVCLGGGGHGHVVMDAIRSRPDRWRLLGYTDPEPAAGGDGTAAYLGSDEVIAELRAEHDARLILGVGSIGGWRARRRIADGVGAPAEFWAVVAHQRAYAAAGADLGPGVFLSAGSVVNPRASLGAHCIVNTGALVEHDCVLEDWVHMAPGSCLGANVHVGEGSHVGLGSRVREGVHIGRDAMIGMGAVVVDDVPDEATVMGVPARRVERNRSRKGEH